MDYKIKTIDSETKKVEVLYRYGDRELMHSFFVDEVNRETIISEVERQYQEFTDAIDKIHVEPDLPDDVASLIQK